MSSELRLKKLRGSGGYVMATVTDEQQMKGNLGGPDLFLAPMGRLDPNKITKHFCNTCEKEFEGPPKIEFENPNEEVAENLILAERGQYICNSCNASIAEYRDFKKQDEAVGVGVAKPLEPQVQSIQPETVPQQTESAIVQPNVTQPGPVTSVTSIEGKVVFDENANKVGIAKQVGIDSTQSMVLVITKEDGTEGSIPWSSIKKIGEVVILGNPEVTAQPGKCSNCGFRNKEGSKFCEDCGNKI
jgi:sporulation protein YlmC with PRC-barrel domain